MYGHRQRLLEKVRTGYKLTALELVEILLFFVIKRRDTKPLAKELLHRFKSVVGILEASPQELIGLKGIGKSTIDLLKTFYYLINNVRYGSMINKDVIGNFQQLLEYCQLKLSHKLQEELHVMLLDHKRRVVHIAEFANGDSTHIDLNPKNIIKLALNYGAISIILAHNHPSGDPSPSASDIQATQYLKQMLNGIQIELEDHIIIASEGFFSFKKQKLVI